MEWQLALGVSRTKRSEFSRLVALRACDGFTCWRRGNRLSHFGFLSGARAFDGDVFALLQH
jgi:hypothetical protein